MSRHCPPHPIPWLGSGLWRFGKFVWGHVGTVQVAVDGTVEGGPLGLVPEDDRLGVTELDAVGLVAEAVFQFAGCHHEPDKGLDATEQLRVGERALLFELLRK